LVPRLNDCITQAATLKEIGVLEIIAMSKYYGDVHAVNNLTLTIESGEIFTREELE
jgi:hypothetical protein